MKKIIVVFLLLCYFLNMMDNKVVIPKEAIRFRILANSNSKIDQNIKKKIKDNVTKEIVNDLENSKDLLESRNIINSNILKYETITNNVLKENNISSKVKLDYGNNYFPKKEYKGVEYKEGNYESLVITLGDGYGDNFWCVLFPPLCTIDEDNNDNYKFYVKEVLDKYF